MDKNGIKSLDKGCKSKEEYFEKESRGYKNVSHRGMYKLVTYSYKNEKKKIKKNWQLPSKSLNSGQAENGHGCSYSASMEAKYCHLYWCLVYSLNCTLEGVLDILCVPNGKSYQSGEFLRPYVQTNP